MQTTTNSDLKWIVYRVHYKGDFYVKVKLLFFYKSNNDICLWLNPIGKPKSFKILRENYDNWEDF